MVAVDVVRRHTHTAAFVAAVELVVAVVFEKQRLAACHY
jgi:hypothetical protein